MASITFDGQSFTINGRRRWLASAGVDYGRLPRALWKNRLMAARQAGFNCIGVRVCWSQHEPEPGVFDFDEDLDLRAFIQLIGELRLLAIVRPGPFIGAGWDAGGLPGWLIDGRPEIVRAGDPAFKEAAARYLSNVMDQIADLQLTAAGAGGPIVLVQNEHQWFRGDEERAGAYLAETARFLREAGVRVPIINTNNLYASSEGELDTWSDGESLFTTARQLRMVRPGAPVMVMDIPAADQPVWGEKEPAARKPDELLEQLAHVLAAGGQSLIDPLAAGVTPGFLSGRDPASRERSYTSLASPAAPVGFTGERTPLYHAVKRITSFTSSFERVFAHLDPDSTHAAITPDDAGSRAGPSVAHLRGAQGSVAFIFRGGARSATKAVPITLPDGASFEADLSGQPVVWCLIDALVGQRSTLDYCNLCAYTTVGDVFVCFGPPGAEAALSINGSPVEATVPRGKTPLITHHEGAAVVICSQDQIDATYTTDDAVYVGCAGLDEDGSPIAHPDFPTCQRIDASGRSERITFDESAPRRRGVTLKEWSVAREEALIDGSSDRYAPIEGPATLAELKHSGGYAWMRVALRSTRGRKANIGFFDANVRIHAYVDGEPLAVIGAGPDAQGRIVPMSLLKGEQTLTFLIEAFGRAAGGSSMGEPVGVTQELCEIAAYRMNKPRLEEHEPRSPVRTLDRPIWGLHDDDLTTHERLTWQFIHRKKSPIYMHADGLSHDALVILNDESVAWLSPGGPDALRFDQEQLRRGKNILQLAPMENAEALLRDAEKHIAFYEGRTPITEGRPWALAHWAPPSDERFEPIAHSAMKGRSGLPTWWRCAFDRSPDDPPVELDLAGLSSGVLFLNGRRIGRYMTSTRTGRAIQPHPTFPLWPEWFNADAPNKLLIFDEHGAAPTGRRLKPM